MVFDKRIGRIPRYEKIILVFISVMILGYCFFVRSTNTGYALNLETGNFQNFAWSCLKISQFNENNIVINCYGERDDGRYDNDILYEVDLDLVLSNSFAVPD